MYFTHGFFLHTLFSTSRTENLQRCVPSDHYLTTAKSSLRTLIIIIMNENSCFVFLCCLEAKIH